MLPYQQLMHECLLDQSGEINGGAPDSVIDIRDMTEEGGESQEQLGKRRFTTQEFGQGKSPRMRKGPAGKEGGQRKIVTGLLQDIDREEGERRMMSVRKLQEGGSLVQLEMQQKWLQKRGRNNDGLPMVFRTGVSPQRSNISMRTQHANETFEKDLFRDTEALRELATQIFDLWYHDFEEQGHLPLGSPEDKLLPLDFLSSNFLSHGLIHDPSLFLTLSQNILCTPLLSPTSSFDLGSFLTLFGLSPTHPRLDSLFQALTNEFHLSQAYNASSYRTLLSQTRNSLILDKLDQLAYYPGEQHQESPKRRSQIGEATKRIAQAVEALVGSTEAAELKRIVEFEFDSSQSEAESPLIRLVRLCAMRKLMGKHPQERASQSHMMESILVSATSLIPKRLAGLVTPSKLDLNTRKITLQIDKEEYERQSSAVWFEDVSQVQMINQDIKIFTPQSQLGSRNNNGAQTTMSYLTPANAQSRLGVYKPLKMTATVTPAEMARTEASDKEGKTRLGQSYDIIKGQLRELRKQEVLKELYDTLVQLNTLFASFTATTTFTQHFASHGHQDPKRGLFLHSLRLALSSSKSTFGTQSTYLLLALLLRLPPAFNLQFLVDLHHSGHGTLADLLRALVTSNTTRVQSKPVQLFRNEDMAQMFSQVERWWEELDPKKQQNVTRHRMVKFLMGIGVIGDDKEFEGLLLKVSPHCESRVSQEMYIRRSDYTRMMYLAIMRGILTRAKSLLSSPELSQFTFSQRLLTLQTHILTTGVKSKSQLADQVNSASARKNPPHKISETCAKLVTHMQARQNQKELQQTGLKEVQLGDYHEMKKEIQRVYFKRAQGLNLYQHGKASNEDSVVKLGPGEVMRRYMERLKTSSKQPEVSNQIRGYAREVRSKDRIIAKKSNLMMKRKMSLMERQDIYASIARGLSNTPDLGKLRDQINFYKS